MPLSTFQATQWCPASLSGTPLFSVVVPVRNEENNLHRCLDSLARMRCDPALFEIIVVDNGSTDSSVKVAQSFTGILALSVLQKPKGYISAVRNAGASVARGKYLAFLDADCEVRSDWLEQASHFASKGAEGILGSSYLIPAESSWIARNWYERERKTAGEVSFVPSGDLFVRRELFLKIGGFDETIQTNEDYDFCRRVRRAGFPVTSLPALGVVHWGTPQSLGRFFHKHRWHGTHVFRVFLRGLPAFYNGRAISLAFYTMFCLLGIVMGVAMWIRSGQSRVLAVFLAGLFAPPMLLGFRDAVISRRLRAALPLMILYLTYAFARVSCLLDWRIWVGVTNNGTHQAVVNGRRETS
jgi:glycosyltransferase involved in cell wall biosynthesis